MTKMKAKVLVYLACCITPAFIWLNQRTFSLFRIKGADVKKLSLFSCLSRFWTITFCLCSKPFTTIPTSGKTRTSSTLQEARLGLIHKRLSYRPTGKHPSPRSASVWRLANRPGSSSSTRGPTLCTHWSLTGNPSPPRWAVKNGRRWLVRRVPYSHTVIRKALML